MNSNAPNAMIARLKAFRASKCCNRHGKKQRENSKCYCRLGQTAWKTPYLRKLGFSRPRYGLSWTSSCVGQAASITWYHACGNKCNLNSWQLFDIYVVAAHPNWWAIVRLWDVQKQRRKIRQKKAKEKKNMEREKQCYSHPKGGCKYWVFFTMLLGKSDILTKHCPPSEVCAMYSVRQPR